MVEKFTIKNGLKLPNKNLQDLGIRAFREGKCVSLVDIATTIYKNKITTESTIVIEALGQLSGRGINVTQETVKEVLHNESSQVIPTFPSH
ncbi:hypothetical protein [Serratia rubidaea]|uniref:hypothetical protein n=1 Tax=Serratia rubidaea TaxID=61652 RepID=UPI00242C695D|nr:hypothetical protein [Serratia rubidaea]MCR0999156.1 hypothetical protein [Serratia rubidaea]